MEKRKLWIGLVILAAAVLIFLALRSTNGKSPSSPPCVPKCSKGKCGPNGCGGKCSCTGGLLCVNGECKPEFEEVTGLSGSGYCKTGKQLNANFWRWDSTQTPSPTQATCQQNCKEWDACLGYDWNDTSKVCQMYTKTGAGGAGASPGYKSSADKYFPAFASPWLCKVPLADLTGPKGKYCMPAFGGNLSQEGAPPCTLSSDKVKCFKKFATTEDFSPYFKANVGVMDSSKVQVVISNPFINSRYLGTTYHTFYYWLINMLKNAKKFVTLINVYWTLGKWQSDDPEDYQSVIYSTMVDALNRGVKITIITSAGAASDEVVCDPFMDQQFTTKINPNLKGSALFRHTKVPYFFHDKIYISENEGYIGGQNLSGSSSIDFGVTIYSDSPLYSDLKQRADYFLGGAKVLNPPPHMKFQYTYDKPYVDPVSKAEYFLALSPFSPVCNTRDFTPVFPQPSMKFSKYGKVGAYFNDSDNQVSYEWWHLYDLVRNAKKFIRITNFDFSFFGSSLSKCGYDEDMANAMDTVIMNGVKVEIWLHDSPMADSMPLNPSSTCGLGVCKTTRDLLAKWNKKDNFTMNYWYTDPYTKSFPPCKLLHSKIFYSDYGLLITSSNFVPDYWGNTSDTAICVRYPSTVPDWVQKGPQNIFDILNTNSKVSNYGKKYTCSHTDPNIDQAGAPCGLDGNAYLCASTCGSCQATEKAGARIDAPNSACVKCLK